MSSINDDDDDDIVILTVSQKDPFCLRSCQPLFTFFWQKTSNL